MPSCDKMCIRDRQWPLKCVNGTLYTLDGPVEDESEIKQRILENIEEYVTSGLSKKGTNILETRCV